MEKKITPPEGFEFKFINENEVQLVPKQSKYPMSIKDIKRFYNIDRNNTYEPFYNNLWEDSNFSSESTAKKFAAMIQLKELCDAWNRIDNFTPKFDGCQENYVITVYNGKITIDYYSSHQQPLAFKDRETAELFLNTFRDLIEQAGDLV